MRTALDAPPQTLDPQEQAFVAGIRSHGWYRTEVSGDADGPGFSYTTGFWLSRGQPELVMFSMKTAIVHAVFWDLFKDAKVGAPLTLHQRTNTVFANGDACIFPIASRHYRDRLGWSRWFYAGDAFPCLQIVWADRSGLFPWEVGFDPAFVGLQIDLTENGWLEALSR